MTHSAPAAKKQKLGGYDFYRSIGSPKYVVAPMVDQSELAWRLLSRSPLPSTMAGPSTTITGSSGNAYVRHPGGAHLVYTPMIHAKIFANSKQASKGGDGQFDISHGQEGSAEPLAGIEAGDRPLFVQFCANDPEFLLAAAKKVEAHCDAVDINLGCPQGIARKGHYGAFLMEDWDLIHNLISTLHKNLAIPVTAKFRIFPDLERTIAYAKMLEAAGAQILTCHGRTREMKGQMTGLADWQIIREVKKAVKVPVFANGNILYAEDVERCLEITGCDGVMTAEGNLSNPAIFLPPDHPHFHPDIFVLARRYLDIVEALRTPTSPSAIKAHLYRMFRTVLDQDEEMRIMISRTQARPELGLQDIRKVVDDIEQRLHSRTGENLEGFVAPPLDPHTGYRKLPISRAQPYIRQTPVSAKVRGDEEFAVGEEESSSTAGVVRSPSPTNTASGCVGESCGSVAALRCPMNACLLHCRQLRALGAGMPASEVEELSRSGGLVGRGCEAHEAKVAARGERRQEKKRNRAEAKSNGKRIRKEYELAGRLGGHPDGGIEQDEERLTATA